MPTVKDIIAQAKSHTKPVPPARPERTGDESMGSSDKAVLQVVVRDYLEFKREVNYLLNSQIIVVIFNGKCKAAEELHGMCNSWKTMWRAHKDAQKTGDDRGAKKNKTSEDATAPEQPGFKGQYREVAFFSFMLSAIRLHVDWIMEKHDKSAYKDDPSRMCKKVLKAIADLEEYDESDIGQWVGVTKPKYATPKDDKPWLWAYTFTALAPDKFRGEFANLLAWKDPDKEKGGLKIEQRRKYASTNEQKLWDYQRKNNHNNAKPAPRGGGKGQRRDRKDRDRGKDEDMDSDE